MSENVLRSVLEESLSLEWARYDNACDHVFSKKHERAMKRIFKLFEKNMSKSGAYEVSKPHYRIRFTKRMALVLLTILFLAIIAGCVAAYFISHNFRGQVYNDHTELFLVNTENCPTTIEEKYYLPCLPDGFEVLQEDSTLCIEYISYINNETKQTLAFCQTVKKVYNGSTHYDTERQDLEEIKINGHYGLSLDYSSRGVKYAVIVWDTGDYILELFSEFTKNELADLAKSAKVCEK